MEIVCCGCHACKERNVPGPCNIMHSWNGLTPASGATNLRAVFTMSHTMKKVPQHSAATGDITEMAVGKHWPLLSKRPCASSKAFHCSHCASPFVLPSRTLHEVINDGKDFILNVQTHRLAHASYKESDTNEWARHHAGILTLTPALM